MFRFTTFLPIAFALLLTGCGSSSSSSNPTPKTVSVTLSQTSATVTVGGTITFSASVQGSANVSVTWSVDGIAGGNATVGTISASGTYTAPSQAGAHTVTATSVADPTKSATAQVTVNASSVTPTISPASATVAPGGSQQYTSNISVTWSVDGVVGGGASTGTISTQGLYTAPSTTGPHRITATSAANASLSATSYLTVVNTSQAAVLTYHNNDARTGAYTEELVLTPSNVNATQFGKILAYPVDAEIYAQPLYMPQLNLPGRGKRDVVFVATQNNSVYAFDADAASSTPTTFWHSNFGPPVSAHDAEGPWPQVGIMSTPVIDATTNTMYLVVESSNTGTNASPFYLYAIDITTGNPIINHVSVTGTVAGTGLDSVGGQITLENSCYQRMGLTLNPVTNEIYIPFGSCNHGWIFAYNKTTLAQVGIFNDTPDSGGGALWASGGAPAVDDTSGDLFFMTGTDTIDEQYITGSTQSGYNNAFVRLDPTGNMSVLTYFSPDDNFALAVNDADLGSGANILVPGNSQHPKELVGGGKDGNVYINDPITMGGFNANSNAVLQNVHLGTTQYNNIFSTPVYWNGFIYFHSNSDVIRAFSWDASAASGQQMSAQSVSAGGATFQTHGATASLSSNGNASGIIWDIDDTNYVGTDPSTGGHAVLHAYDATNLATLYNSSQAGSRDTAGIAGKFTVPTIGGGKVFVPTNNELDIYGLLP